MTIIEMLGQSAALTLLGMGVVFGFLIILVFVISLFGKIVNLNAEKKNNILAQVSPPSAHYVAPETGDPDNDVAVAISAAVTQYRKDQ